MAAFSQAMPQQQPTDDTSVVGRYEAMKELQRAKLAGFASGVADNSTAPVNAGMNPALTPPASPAMGAPPQAPMQNGQPVPTPMGMGRLVTKPTTAVLAEEPGSVEMVVPLNSNPDNKTSISMLSPMSRYKRP